MKSKRPDLSIGVFTGYQLCMNWLMVAGAGGRLIWTGGSGSAILFQQIKRFLDFAVFGRFWRTMASSDKPLCGSRNQRVVFFSDRYSEQDLEPQGYEVHIGAQGATAITGFQPPDV